MEFRRIIPLGITNNKKGDVFCRLMGDFFHSLGYDQPRFNIHKAGRELDVKAHHRIERKIAIAECKAHKTEIGGDDINKFIGALSAEKIEIAKSDYKDHDVEGYFVSLSGYTQTAIEQENQCGNTRAILITPSQIIKELVLGKIIVPIEAAIAAAEPANLRPAPFADLIAHSEGWVWALYFTNGQALTDVAFVHAEGKLLVNELAAEICRLDKAQENLFGGLNIISDHSTSLDNREVRKKYFKYLEHECGDIQFEGLPTDKDAGAVKVRLENIFIIPSLEKANDEGKAKSRHQLGAILRTHSKLAILAKPGGGKSTLIKRLALAYALPSRRKLINDDLPKEKWFPIFLRCRELGNKVNQSITEIIQSIVERAEISECKNSFAEITSAELQKGNVLLLIDGIDEISDDRSRVAFINQLRVFIATYPKIHLVVTSREVGFRAVSGILANHCEKFKLASLNPTEIESLSVKWHTEIVDDSEATKREAIKLAHTIISEPRILKLAENPLLMTTLLFVRRWAGYLPTKKIVLYQEMIKLLMVTWNVEGHEQLDIDEAEPQLAYVAYWMVSQGVQTITLNELKARLTEARKQMPEILGYTKVSIPEFIRRVESRSSLLILIGHKDEGVGLTPIYEFLHLSFQEYLCAKAITECYLPADAAKLSALEILKEFSAEERWKEVIPLVAVMLKRECNALIEFFVESSKDVNEKNQESHSYIYSELLGSCLANEIQIAPQLLDESLKSFLTAKHPRDKQVLHSIFSSKFGDAAKAKLKDLYFSKFDDELAPILGGHLGESYIHLHQENGRDLLESAASDLHSDDRITRGISAFGFMEHSFYQRSRSEGQSNKSPALQTEISSIMEGLVSMMNSGDLNSIFPAYWSIAWIRRAYIFESRLLNEILKSLAFGFLCNHGKNVARINSWAIQSLFSLNRSFSADLIDKLAAEPIIRDRLENPRNIYDRATCLYLCWYLGLEIERDRVLSVLRGIPKHGLNYATHISLLIEKYNLERKDLKLPP